MFENLDDTNKTCLAILRAILMESRYSMNRDAGFVNLWIPLVRDAGKKILSITMSLDKFHELLNYLDLALRDEKIERKSQA